MGSYVRELTISARRTLLKMLGGEAADTKERLSYYHYGIGVLGNSSRLQLPPVPSSPYLTCNVVRSGSASFILSFAL